MLIKMSQSRTARKLNIERGYAALLIHAIREFESYATEHEDEILAKSPFWLWDDNPDYKDKE